MLEVRLLGGLSAALDGRPVELPADARARELLARLALAPGPQGRSALAGRLRPDVPEDSARKTLRNALYELRRTLGGDALVVAGDRIALGDAVRVDVREFRGRLAEGDLEGAAERGHGELLDGFDGDWARQARDEHAADLAGVLGTLAARAEEAGDLTVAVAWTRRRLEVEPLSEAAHRDLIRLLTLAGDRPAALTAARATTERLRSELGIAPSAETRALVEDVRRGRIARGAPASAPRLPAPLAAAAHPEGRGSALERLEGAWSDAVAGALRFALVTGEAGIGKTTLAGELGRRAHAQGGAVLLGRCDEHALVPFQPWVQALERLLEALPAADADHWLTAHDGALARLLPARSADQGAAGGPRERYLAFELVRGLLADVAGRWPVLLVLDDLHWADADSLTLLRHLARSVSLARLLVVLCARPAELAPAVAQTLAELRREGPVAHVELAGLDDAAVAAVIAQRTGATDHEAARRYRVRSGGNPFFVDELLRAGGDVDALPAGVRDVIARRLARLDGATQRALDAAAVCGQEFDVATVARAEDRPIAEVLEALDGAIEAALVIETDRRGRYAFAHALVTDTIVSGLPASRRARLHLQVADALTERDDPGAVGAGETVRRVRGAEAPAERHGAGEGVRHPPGAGAPAGGREADAVGAGEVVRHLRGAGALVAAERLVTWELAAAREAGAALAHSDAAAHYQAALAARPGDAEILLALGDAHDRAGRRSAARAAFAEAAEIAGAAGNPGLLARAALGHGGRTVVIAAADPMAVRLLEDALAATPAGDHATAARLLGRLAVELYYADPVRAGELSALAVERAGRADDPAALAAALNARRAALWFPHHAAERLAAAEEMIAAADAAGDREAMLQGRNWRVVDLLELGRVRDAAAEIDAYDALAGAVALPHFGWYVPLWRATLALLAGRWEEAGELSQRTLELGRRADDPNALLFVGIQRRTSLHPQGRLSEIDRTQLVEGGATSPAAAEWLAYVALVDAATGATEEARRLLRELRQEGALAMNANWHAACVLADAAALVGDRDAGAALYAMLEPHAHLFPVIARAVGCLGSAEAYVGRLAGLPGLHDGVVTRLRHAVAENDRAGAAPHAASALLRLGEELTTRGEPGAARDALHQAAKRAEALDMTVLAADAARLLGATAA